MSELKHLDDIDRRAHQDLALQWLVVLTMVFAIALVVFEISRV
jgi:hypothetical protein